MNRDVIVKVKGIQGGLTADDAIEMITVGQCFDKNGKTFIKYEDRVLDQENPTSTTIKISDGSVTVIRFGATNTQMIFEEGKAHYSPYDTPYGLFEITVATQEITMDRQEDRLDLKVMYTIDVNHSGETASEFIVEVTNQS